MTITLDGSAGMTAPTGAVYDGLQTATAQTASGTAVDFTSVPLWATRVTVMFNGLSASGANPFLVQLGSGSIQSTGYVSFSNLANNSNGTSGTNSTSGMIIWSNGAAYAVSGQMVLTNVTNNVWVASMVGYLTSNATVQAGGTVTLSGTLDRIRIACTSTDTFDAGTVNIIYE